MDSWQTLGWRSFMTLIRCFSCADPVVSNLWWFKSSREIVMSLKTTRGVTWENQILWSPAHCEAVVTCGLQSRSLVTAVLTDVRQEKTNIMKLANEVLPEFPDPFFLPPVSRVATWVCDLSCQDFLSPSWSQCLLSCWPGTNLHTQYPALCSLETGAETNTRNKSL